MKIPEKTPTESVLPRKRKTHRLSPPPRTIRLSEYVTIIEDSHNLQNLDISEEIAPSFPSPPFKEGQLVRVVKGRYSRRSHIGQFGQIASVVRGSSDVNWTIYVVFPGKNQAKSFYPHELALILQSGLLVGGAA